MKTKLIPGMILLTFTIAACAGTATQAPAAQPIVIPTLTVASPIESSMPTEAVLPATEAPVAGGVSFANDVAPILAASCNNCHGGDQTKAGLNLTTYDGLMAGSFDGAVILPGNAAESVLVQLVTDGKMPKRGDKLTPEQVQIISEWVAAGALNN